MTLGVNGIKTLSAIDSAAIRDVAGQIFTKADAKQVEFGNFDFTKFQKPELGVDLYSQGVDIQKTQQIAVRNAGLDINLNQSNIANLQYLNSQAALGAYNSKKTMEGKIYVPQEGNSQDLKSREVFALPASVNTQETTDLGKDKRGSNPFAFISTNGKKNENEDDLNIAA